MPTIHAVYEDGVFRPSGPVELPEHCAVEFEPRIIQPAQAREALDRIYETLSHRFETGQSDTAARHNEHQP